MTIHKNKIRARKFLLQKIASLHPAYFALVMATGILSIALDMFNLKMIGQCFFIGNVFFYISLWGLYIWRGISYPQKIKADLNSHQKSFGFLTVVAATNIIGIEFIIYSNNIFLATVAWWTGLLLWITLINSTFFLLAIKSRKLRIENSINGGWLMAVVSTQSICVLGAILIPNMSIGGTELTIFLLTSFWLFGGMLYLWIISLIFYRYMFFQFKANNLLPPYWINMGAVAISTLAGYTLISAIEQQSYLHDLIPFIKGLTLFYWATATWWIPVLILLGVWRHGMQKIKFNYDPLFWSLVFPLGMYSACTYAMNKMFQIDLLNDLAFLFLILALIAWGLTFMSMMKRPLKVIILGIQSTKKGL